VGLKAKTPEGLNLDNAAIAHVAVLLEKKRISVARSARSGSSKRKSR
jgi:hypothetical protein